MGYAADGTDLSKDFLDFANEAAKRMGARRRRRARARPR